MSENKKENNRNSISCVIATHNRDKLLKEAVHSVINQTFPPIEIIVVNDLPNEHTKKVVEELTKQSPITINYIEHNMKGKGSISYNLGASKVKGEFIAFLNDDDLWEKDYLKKMSILIKEKDSKICYAGTSKIKNGQKSPHKQLEDNLEMKEFLLKNPGCQQSNLVVNKDLYISLGGFDDYIIPSIDKDFLIRALYFGYNYNVLKERLVIQNKHSGDQLTDINIEFLTGIKKFFKKHEWLAGPILRIKFWIKYWRAYIKILIN